MSVYCNPIKDTEHRREVVAVLQYFALHDYYKTNFDPNRSFDEISEDFSLKTKLTAIMCNIGHSNQARYDVAEWITELIKIMPGINEGSVACYQSLITQLGFDEFYTLGTDKQEQKAYSIEITNSVKADTKIMIQNRLKDFNNPKYLVLRRNSSEGSLNYPKNIKIQKSDNSYTYRLEGIITKEANGTAMLYIHYGGNYAKFGKHRIRIDEEDFYEYKLSTWVMLFYERKAINEIDNSDTVNLKIQEFEDHNQNDPGIDTIIPKTKGIKCIFRVLPGIVDDTLDYHNLPERELSNLNAFTENLLKINKMKSFGTNENGKMNYDLIWMKVTGKPSIMQTNIDKLHKICQTMYNNGTINIDAMIIELNKHGYNIQATNQNQQPQATKDTVLQLDTFDWTSKAEELDSSELVRIILEKRNITFVKKVQIPDSDEFDTSKYIETKDGYIVEAQFENKKMKKKRNMMLKMVINQ